MFGYDCLFKIWKRPFQSTYTLTGAENLYVQIKIPEPEQKHSTLVSYAGERSDVIVINNNTCLPMEKVRRPSQLDLSL